MQYVNALSPPIAGERLGVEGWGGNGHLLEAYSTEPTCKPQSTMCSFWDLWRYAVAVAAGRGKLKNVIIIIIIININNKLSIFCMCNNIMLTQQHDGTYLA